MASIGVVKDFQHVNWIKTPEELGMSSRGDIGTLTNDIAGLINYIQILVEGGGRAQKTSQPLGNRYFFKTGAKCKDVITNTEKDRYLYIDNVAAGEEHGMIPALIHSVGKINPTKLLEIFKSDPDVVCAAVTLDTLDENLNRSRETQFVNKTDIKGINPCVWVNKRNPVSGVRGGTCSNMPKNGTCDGCTIEGYSNLSDTITGGKGINQFNQMNKYDNYIYIMLMITFFLLICLKIKKK
jgi:hypothetical protein